MRLRRSTAAVLTAIAIALSAAPVAADEYDPQLAAHPMRIVAYALHPVGVVLDLLIFRPAHWIGSYKPLAALFGHEPYRD
jgi:hypothetical protein